MIDVECAGAVTDCDSDAVIAAHCIGDERGLEIRKGAEVVGLGSITVRRVVWYLGLLTIALLEFPNAKLTGGLQLHRDVFISIIAVRPPFSWKPALQTAF